MRKRDKFEVLNWVGTGFRHKQPPTHKEKNTPFAFKTQFVTRKGEWPRWRKEVNLNLKYWTEHWLQRRQRERGFDRSEGARRRPEANRWHQRCWTKRPSRQKQRPGTNGKERPKPFPSRIWCFRSTTRSPSRRNWTPLFKRYSLSLHFACVLDNSIGIGVFLWVEDPCKVLGRKEKRVCQHLGLVLGIRTKSHVRSSFWPAKGESGSDTIFFILMIFKIKNYFLSFVFLNLESYLFQKFNPLFLLWYGLTSLKIILIFFCRLL